MKCPHCGQEHPDNTKFCPETGQTISLLKSCQNKECKNFGKYNLQPDAQFCPECGCSVEDKKPLKLWKWILFSSVALVAIIATVILVVRVCDRKDDPIIKNDTLISNEEPVVEEEIVEEPLVEGVSTLDFTVDGVSFTMVYVQGGSFTMGATPEQVDDAFGDEKPAHRITLTNDYYIGETEVTQELWETVMGSNPSEYKGYDHPVGSVSWDDCQAFIRKLNEKTGRTFRLPTEAEWEYAARGGNRSKGYKYSGSNSIGDVAWYDGNSNYQTHPVKTKSPNELGLYDMSGNVYEWCYDRYGDYGSGAQTNPAGPAQGAYRVNRGGSWYNYAGLCRVSNRINFIPSYRYINLGFRLVLVP